MHLQVCACVCVCSNVLVDRTRTVFALCMHELQWPSEQAWEEVYVCVTCLWCVQTC